MGNNIAALQTNSVRQKQSGTQEQGAPNKQQTQRPHATCQGIYIYLAVVCTNLPRATRIILRIRCIAQSGRQTGHKTATCRSTARSNSALGCLAVHRPSAWTNILQKQWPATTYLCLRFMQSRVYQAERDAQFALHTHCRWMQGRAISTSCADLPQTASVNQQTCRSTQPSDSPSFCSEGLQTPLQAPCASTRQAHLPNKTVITTKT